MNSGRAALLPPFLCFLIFFLLAPVLSCVSAPAAPETPIQTDRAVPEAKPSGLAEEIKGLVELGTPPSLIRALDIVRSRDLSSTEYGRAMGAAAVALLQKLYPEVPADLPPSDPPAAHPYARILKDAERGAYTPAPGTSQDYLEHVLPFLALLGETRPERLAAALPDLSRAAALGRTSVLDSYFAGLAAERRGDLDAAAEAYERSRSVSADAYPAAVGAARVLSARGKGAEAAALLSELKLRFPDNGLVKRELAKDLYDLGDWAKASGAVAEVLQKDPKDKAFLLMRARVLIEQGLYPQALPVLDSLAAADASDRLYLFLRARVQAEGYKNRDAALGYLRSLLRARPDDEEAELYAARLLLDSTRPDDLSEGRALLGRLAKAVPRSAGVLDLALKDALARSAWTSAASYADELLSLRRGAADLRAAYQAYRGAGNASAALGLARELYDRDQSNADSAVLLAASLIASGQKAEAGRLIEAKLPGLGGGSLKSRFYYYRSRLKADEEGAMGDLRSSLFEDPRNFEALTAMLEIYRSRKDERRAVYYLKQALALAPDDAVLLRYKEEYASAMAGTP